MHAGCVCGCVRERVYLCALRCFHLPHKYILILLWSNTPVRRSTHTHTHTCVSRHVESQPNIAGQQRLFDKWRHANVDSLFWTQSKEGIWVRRLFHRVWFQVVFDSNAHQRMTRCCSCSAEKRQTHLWQHTLTFFFFFLCTLLVKKLWPLDNLQIWKKKARTSFEKLKVLCVCVRVGSTNMIFNLSASALAFEY